MQRHLLFITKLRKNRRAFGQSQHQFWFTIHRFILPALAVASRLSDINDNPTVWHDHHVHTTPIKSLQTTPLHLSVSPSVVRSSASVLSLHRVPGWDRQYGGLSSRRFLSQRSVAGSVGSADRAGRGGDPDCGETQHREKDRSVRRCRAGGDQNTAGQRHVHNSQCI